MKIIHTSDLHLDSPLTTRLASDKVRERKRELLETMKRIISDAREIGAAGIIIAGDLFDSEKVSRQILENVAAIMASAPDILFFYLHGNHEKRLLPESGVHLPENLKMFGDGWTYMKLGDVNIIGRCSTEKDMFSDLRLVPSEKNIVVLHGELRDHSDIDGAIGKRELDDLPIDYLALGHYHSYSAETVGRRTLAVYPGTPEGRGFDEAGEKGYVVINTDKYGIYHEFKHSARRTLKILRVSVDGIERASELQGAVEKAVEGISSSDLVRVVLHGQRELDLRIDTTSISRIFSSKFYYFEMQDTSRLKYSAEDFKNDKSLKGEFIRGVISDQSLTDEQRNEIISLGLSALMGEELE